MRIEELQALAQEFKDRLDHLEKLVILSQVPDRMVTAVLEAPLPKVRRVVNRYLKWRQHWGLD